MNLPYATDSQYSKFKKQTKLKHSTGMFQRKEPNFLSSVPFLLLIPLPLSLSSLEYCTLSRFSPEMRPNTWLRTENWLVHVCLRRPITCIRRLEAQENRGVSLHVKAWVPEERAFNTCPRSEAGKEALPSSFSGGTMLMHNGEEAFFTNSRASLTWTDSQRPPRSSILNWASHCSLQWT